MVYLNGRYLPLEEATIPVLDRGFIFGDGVYEVVPAYSRKPFRLREHLDRLEHSLAAIRLANPHPSPLWEEVIHRLVDEAPWEDSSVYLQISRGPAPRDHAFPKAVTPTIFAMATELQPPSEQARQKGVAAITLPDLRWLRCDIKSTSLLANVLARQQALDAGAAECLLVRDGFVTEGSSSSVFIVTKGLIVAPPKSHLILPGITYDVVTELARQHNLPLEIREMPVEEVKSAEEIWLTSSTKEVLPVTTLDGAAVGGGYPGPAHQLMYELYQQYKHRIMRGQANPG